MTYCFLLSGEHPELPRAEVEAVLRAEGIEFSVERQEENLLFVDADRVDGVERLAMSFEVAELLHTFPPDTYQKLAAKDIEAEKRFMVRAIRIDDTETPDELESNIGRIINKNSEARVDLDDPEEVFRVYVVDGEAHLCRLTTTVDRGDFESRQNQFRPFQKPVTIHPRMARTLVNLAEVAEGDTLLDPFCGTGGILLEAGIVGCDIYGMDIQQEMVDGTEQNLAAFDLEGDIRQGAIEDIMDHVEEPFDAVVTDLPYGKASKVKGDPTETFLDLLPDLTAGKAVFMTDRDEVAGHEPDFELFVHRSMDRYIYVIEP